MTTSEPQAGRRDADTHENRSIGQRIRDAVLGDEPGDGRGTEPTGRAADTGYADPDRGGPADPDRSAAADYADPTPPDSDAAGPAGRETGFADPTDREITDADRSAYDSAWSGDVDSGADAPRDASYDDAGAGVTRGVGGAPASGGSAYSTDDPGRRVAPETFGAGQAVADPVDDDVAQDGTPRHVADTGYGDDPRGTAAPADRDLVTQSYDPDRDTGYDPHASGTAATEPVGADRDVRGDDRPGGDDPRGYEPAADAGYVDERRADVDRTTGDRDADYDTGRVDADQDTTHRSTGLGTAAAGGAGVAAGVAGSHHQDAEPRHTEDRDTRFDAVDDTSTVDATSTGRTTSGTTLDDTTAPSAPTTTPGDVAADRRAEAVADEADEADESGVGGRERLVPADRADEYSSRWDALKGDFVDEPRRAVAQADDLVGELLDEIQRLFSDQRRDLEQGFDHDRASTEDLRLALRRYRSFFDRLLSF